MKKIYISIFAGLTLLLMGCNDFLDLTPTNAVTDKVVWTKTEYATSYVNSCYTLLDYYSQYENGQCAYGLTEGVTDMLKYGSKASNQTGAHYGFLNQFVYAQMGQTAASACFLFSNWSSAYSKLAAINEFLYTMHKYASFDQKDITRFEAEAKFFRGLVYFELVKRHQEVIIYKEDMLSYKKDMPLSSKEESWQQVYDDLKFAAENLPDKWTGEDAGRVTSGAAYALLSRAMLYAERWQDALDAANEVEKKGLYSLMPGSTSADYAKCFSTTALNGNTEAILDYTYTNGVIDHNFDYFFSPGGDEANKSLGLGTPTQEMVESYEQAGGGVVDWSAWHVAGGTLATPPYADLEPRFGASILYNGASWKNRKIEPFMGGADGYTATGTEKVAGKTTTGYYLRKLVDENHTDLITRDSEQPWIAIRYAEVLLNRAEAAYRLSKTDIANADIAAVRSRVGLSYTPKVGEELWNAIRQERKVELAYEGQYFWDLCRWKVLVKEQNGTRVHGLMITPEGAEFRYTYVDCDEQDRQYSEKIYRLPMPETELSNNSLVSQYPNWN